MCSGVCRPLIFVDIVVLLSSWKKETKKKKSAANLVNGG